MEVVILRECRITTFFVSKVLAQIINNSKVVLATNSGADMIHKQVCGRGPDGCRKNLICFDVCLMSYPTKVDRNQEINLFDIVVVDEAAQALEASCWIPLQLGHRCVLGGDHLQLPPTIHIKDGPVLKALERTLFERAMAIPGSTQRMLEVQYRMNDRICKWSSDELYGGRLVPAESVRHRLLKDLPSVALEEAKSTAVVRRPV